MGDLLDVGQAALTRALGEKVVHSSEDGDAELDGDEDDGGF